MDPFLVSAVALIAFAVLMVAIAWRRWTKTADSLARVEKLRALVAEASEIAAPTAVDRDADVALSVALSIDAPPAAAVSMSHQFVVTVPDAADSSTRQLSFQRTEGRT